jgi:hypothetical protein
VGWVADLLLIALLTMLALVAGFVIALALVVAAWNTGVVLWSRWCCHRSVAHPAKAHHGDSLADRYAQQVPPLWRQVLTFPPLRWPR